MTSLDQERLSENQEFPIAKARELVKDLYRPNPWIYWGDFLTNVILGWSAFVVTLMKPVFSIQHGFCFLVAVLALYRSVLFIHEIAHFKKGAFEVVIFATFLGQKMLSN